MIITKKHADRLVREGKAEFDGEVRHENRYWQIVLRYDLQRVDHCVLPDTLTSAERCELIADPGPIED